MIGGILICKFNYPNLYIADWVRKMMVYILLPYGLSLILYTTKQSCIIQILSFHGRNSLIVMVAHYSFLLTICTLFNKYWGTGGVSYGDSFINLFCDIRYCRDTYNIFSK